MVSVNGECTVLRKMLQPLFTTHPGLRINIKHSSVIRRMFIWKGQKKEVLLQRRIMSELVFLFGWWVSYLCVCLEGVCVRVWGVYMWLYSCLSVGFCVSASLPVDLPVCVWGVSVCLHFCFVFVLFCIYSWFVCFFVFVVFCFSFTFLFCLFFCFVCFFFLVCLLFSLSCFIFLLYFCFVCFFPWFVFFFFFFCLPVRVWGVCTCLYFCFVCLFLCLLLCLITCLSAFVYTVCVCVC